ncbi:Uncharacterized lipoprotein syc1174_c [Linum perenne]
MEATLLLHRCRPFFRPPAGSSNPSIRIRTRRASSVRCSSKVSLRRFRKEYTSVMIVPTGVGAAIGGFAGDALPVARALSSVVDCLITHPNVRLIFPILVLFAEGMWGLEPVHQNKVGLVLDCGIEEELRIRHLQVADAARASLGLPVVEYIVTDTPLEVPFVEKWVDPISGQSTGRIRHPDSLLRSVRTLINESQVNAVAVVGRFPDDDADDVDEYRQGMVCSSLPTNFLQFVMFNYLYS